MMSYYKRLLSQQRDGGPSFKEANDDFARMIDSQYGVLGPISDPRVRHRR